MATTVQAAGGRVEHRLPREPGSVALGRSLAAQAAEGDLSEQAAADLQLVLSEILTNAVLHGGGEEILLALTPRRDLLCVQVTDSGPGFVPRPRAMASADTGGFGLFLVEKLTKRWGMTREEGRTRVWFELTRS